VTFNSQCDRAHCAPWGLEGGLEGTGNAVAVRSNGEWKEDFPNAKVLTMSLTETEAFRLRSGGGGGFGDPLDRPLEDVRHDVKQGYVSIDSARDHYAVVVDPETFALDADATAALRATRAK
jgi:N-methylhydantoinase B